MDGTVGPRGYLVRLHSDGLVRTARSGPVHLREQGLDTICDELAGVVQTTLEPASVQVRIAWPPFHAEPPMPTDGLAPGCTGEAHPAGYPAPDALADPKALLKALSTWL